MSRLRELRAEVDKLKRENNELKDALQLYKNAYYQQIGFGQVLQSRVEEEVEKRITAEVELELKELDILTKSPLQEPSPDRKQEKN